MPNPRATVIDATGANPPADPAEGTRVTNLGTGGEPDAAAPKITDADNSSFDTLMDDVLKKHPPTEEGKPPVEVKGDGQPKVVPAEKRPPATAATGKPPTTPKEKPAEAKPPAETPPPSGDTKPAPGETKPPAGETPPASGETKPPAAPTDPEIDGIQKPRNLSPANDSNWETLRALAKKHKKEAQDARAMVEELNKTAGKIPENIEKELTSLRDMRRRFDLQNDPHFVENYDKPINQRNDQLYGILKQMGFKEEGIKEMKDKGGPMAYPMTWWETEIIDRLKGGKTTQEQTAAVIVRSLLEKNIQAQFERQQEVAKAASGESEWMKERIASIDNARKQEQQFIIDRLNEVQKQVPWANPVEIKPEMTAEQKAEAEKQNQFYGQTVERLKIALNPRSPQDKVETALAACLAFKLHQDLAELEASSKAKIDALTEQINKMKGAGSTTTAGKAAPTTKPQAKTFGQLVTMKNDDAIEQGMAEAGM